MPGLALALRRQGAAAFASQGHGTCRETGVPLDPARKLTGNMPVIVAFI
ncbi:MAG: hypothetical protein LW715_09600 [Rhodobacter sp.]|nr:hypothetical protein [Rhodobacter sp.]MCE2749006.1 hypothetical protein [Rhodobacter sp.]